MGRYLSIYQGPFVRLASEIREQEMEQDQCSHPLKGECPLDRPHDHKFCPECGVKPAMRFVRTTKRFERPDFESLFDPDDDDDDLSCDDVHNAFSICHAFEDGVSSPYARTKPERHVRILIPNQRGVIDRETSIEPYNEGSAHPVDPMVMAKEIRRFEDYYAAWLEKFRTLWPMLKVEWGVVTDYT